VRQRFPLNEAALLSVRGKRRRGGRLNRLREGSHWLLRVLMEHIDSTGSRQDDQFDPAALGRVLHLFHHRQFAVSLGPDDELEAFPRDAYPLLKAEWGRKPA
jgi:hypothetical protein